MKQKIPFKKKKKKGPEKIFNMFELIFEQRRENKRSSGLNKVYSSVSQSLKCEAALLTITLLADYIRKWFTLVANSRRERATTHPDFYAS